MQLNVIGCDKMQDSLFHISFYCQLYFLDYVEITLHSRITFKNYEMIYEQMYVFKFLNFNTLFQKHAQKN